MIRWLKRTVPMSYAKRCSLFSGLKAYCNILIFLSRATYKIFTICETIASSVWFALKTPSSSLFGSKVLFCKEDVIELVSVWSLRNMAVMRAVNMKDALTICVKKWERIKRESENDRLDSKVSVR
jgi:hypothetical protein